MPKPTEVPTVADYAHWGEEAEQVWYEENRYDLLYGGEPDHDPYEEDDGYDPTDPDEEAVHGQEGRSWTGGWE